MVPILIFVLISNVVAFEFNPTAKLEEGVLEGIWEESFNGRQFASFERVPYARPPIGQYRFEPPQPMQPWEGTWDATGPVEVCLQYEPLMQTVTGDEDCLFLNIYSPMFNSSAGLPVLVFIPGGAFMYGAGAFYDPTTFMDLDMVVVTFNYRLGPFGFMSTGDELAPGNVGLKDQAFALRWIQKNIRKFGGDPDNVTLMGHSAGGASVHYQMLSPMARGTFQKAVLLSGSAFLPWAFAPKPAEKASRLAELVGCPSTPTEKLLKCLRATPGNVIANATIDMFDWKEQLFSDFRPTIEPDVKGAFLTKHPYEATNSGDFPDIPMLVAITSEEGLYPAGAFIKEDETSPSLLPEIEENWNDISKIIFKFKDSLSKDKVAEVARRIKQHYFEDQPVEKKTFTKLVQALSDRLFLNGISKMTDMFAKRNQSPLFMYRYSFQGEKSFSNFLSWSQDKHGVCHGDDLFHMFRVPLGFSRAPTDLKMTKMLNSMLHTFITTGAPKLDDGEKVPEWPKTMPGNKTFMEIHSPQFFEMKTSSNIGDNEFWDSLSFNENEHYSNTV